jgi:hypothetical protein
VKTARTGPKVQCPFCPHTPHGLVEQCPHEDWDDDDRRCTCTYRRADDMLSGDAARFNNRLAGKPGPWHLMLARQDGFGGERIAALCGTNIYSANAHRTERKRDFTDLDGKKCLKCFRLAAKQETP